MGEHVSDGGWDRGKSPVGSVTTCMPLLCMLSHTLMLSCELGMKAHLYVITAVASLVLHIYILMKLQRMYRDMLAEGYSCTVLHGF